MLSKEEARTFNWHDDLPAEGHSRRERGKCLGVFRLKEKH
jgi:hypothetical protein